MCQSFPDVYGSHGSRLRLRRATIEAWRSISSGNWDHSPFDATLLSQFNHANDFPGLFGLHGEFFLTGNRSTDVVVILRITPGQSRVFRASQCAIAPRMRPPKLG